MAKRGRPKLSHLDIKAQNKKKAELADVRLTKKYGFRRSRFSLNKSDMKDSGYWNKFIGGPVVKTAEQVAKEEAMLAEERKYAQVGG